MIGVICIALEDEIDVLRPGTGEDSAQVGRARAAKTVHHVLDVSRLSLRVKQEGCFYCKVMHHRKLIRKPDCTCSSSS